MKRGYTLIEVMISVFVAISVMFAAFTLYSQYMETMLKQSKMAINDEEIASAFLAINQEVRNSKYIEQSDNIVDLGDSKITLENNCLYLNSELLISNNSISIKVDKNNSLVIDIGGEQYWFKSINTKEEQ